MMVGADGVNGWNGKWRIRIRILITLDNNIFGKTNDDEVW